MKTTPHAAARSCYDRPSDGNQVAVVVGGIVTAAASVGAYALASSSFPSFLEGIVIGLSAAIFSTLILSVALAND